MVAGVGLSLRSSATKGTRQPHASPSIRKPSIPTLNFDIVTNVGRYTAPVAGFYQFNGSILLTSPTSRFLIALFKNGVEYKRGADVQTATNTYALSVSALVQLAATDYVEVHYYTDTARAVATSTATSFDGFLVSTT